MCFPVNIPKVLGIIILGAAFELSFNIRKEFLKKSQWRYCLCFNQLGPGTNTKACKQFNYHRAFVFLAKFLQEGDDDLSICVDERSLCGLSLTGDIKVPQRSALWTSIKELFSLSKFDNSSPSVTRDKDICQSHMIMR